MNKITTILSRTTATVAVASCALLGQALMAQSNDTEANIPDSNLRAAIESALGKDSGATITVGEMESLTGLYADSAGIADVTGLEHATALEDLSLYDNSIVDISPLAGLTAVTYLELGSNQIADVAPLSELTALTILYLEYNKIADVSTLALLTSLTTLWVSGNPIADLTPLAGLTSLVDLDLGDMGVTDISFLSALTKLNTLYLWGNQIADVAPLAGLAALTRLELGQNQISDVSPLAGLTSLTALGIDENQITDVAPLASLTSLTRLALDDNQIGDVSALASLTSLDWLWLHGNEIADVTPLGSLTSLGRLWLHGNEIADVTPLAGLTSLFQLWLGDNEIADVAPLASLTSLNRLALYGNRISDVSALANLTSLTELQLHRNQIEDLSPLVANNGLDEGDEVDVRQNPLSNQSVDTHIPALLERGVVVHFGASSSVRVASVAFHTQPQAGNTYHAGERIEVGVEFSDDVVLNPWYWSSDMQLALTIGDKVQYADLFWHARRTLMFVHEVETDDVDEDGIAIAADALVLNGTTVRDRDGNDVSTDLQSVADDPDHRVDGRVADTAPTVRLARIVGRPRDGETYGVGETISVEVWFGKNVQWRGDVRLPIDIGGALAWAKPAFSCADHCRTMRFAYIVRGADRDSDGISVGAALVPHGGWIRDRYGNDADLDLSEHAIADDASWLVDGAVDPPPSIARAFVNGPGGHIFKLNEPIYFLVVLTEPVRVRGTPTLKFEIGGESRTAIYRRKFAYSSAEQYLEFEYRVAPGDTGALSLPPDVEFANGTIEDLSGQPADSTVADSSIWGGPSVQTELDTGGPVVTRLDLRASRGDQPLDPGQVLQQNDSLWVVVLLDEYFELDAPAVLAINIGGRPVDVPAAYATLGFRRSLDFNYIVRAGDEGELAISRDALTAAPGTAIRDGAGNVATLDLGDHAIAPGDSFMVAGGADDVPPVLQGHFGYRSPDPYAGTVGAGERLDFIVRFDEPVTVDRRNGDPTVHLVLGTQSRRFMFDGYADLYGDRKALKFAYYVQADDFYNTASDLRIDLNGATVRDTGGNDAVLDLPPSTTTVYLPRADGEFPPPSYPRVQTASYVSELATVPGPDRSYGAGEPIDIPVYYSEPVDVSGTPMLPFTIGGETRRAAFADGSGSRRLVFRYHTASADVGGVDLPYTHVELNGGAITGLDKDAASLGVPAFASVTRNRYFADGSRRADVGSVDNLADIPDESLRRAVAGALGKSADASVTADEVAGLTVLKARNSGVTNLSGLELATELETLDLAGNAIVDLAPLATLTNLTRLDLSNNRIRDISALVANTGLGDGDAVYLHGNPLDAASAADDIAALRARGVAVYLVDVSVAAASAYEGGTLEFAVLLTSAATEDVELAWTVVSGDAETTTPGGDYPAGQAGTVTIAAGDTSAAFAVRTNADQADEPHETLRVVLSRSAAGLPEGVSLTDAEALGLIVEPGTPAAHAPLFPPAGHASRQGFARVINRGGPAVVHIDAIDDTGYRAAVSLALGAGETVHFNSNDLEAGSIAKGLARGTGSGSGDWRLEFRGVPDVLAYMRTRDGFLTSLHDLVPADADGYRVPIFNPGGNRSQVSWLRLFNAGTGTAAVTISGTDDTGAPSPGQVGLELAAGEARTISAADLEAGTNLEGALGAGSGKWELRLTSDQPVGVANLLESPTGHLTNLSTWADNTVAGDGGTIYHVSLFPSASDADGRQGFVRVVNRGAAGTVSVRAYDDSARTYDPVSLEMGANQTVHFNSNDLELGNSAKGLARGIGSGTGDWRLELESSLELSVLAYVRRTEDGFLTGMHDVAAFVDGAWRLPVFNPGRNHNQVSLLRLVNPGSVAAAVTVRGIDDAGADAADAVLLTVPAGRARTLTVQELESGAAGLQGQLGSGTGKWRLVVEADQSIQVMGLLESPTGHLTNLSSWPVPTDALE